MNIYKYSEEKILFSLRGKRGSPFNNIVGKLLGSIFMCYLLLLNSTAFAECRGDGCAKNRIEVLSKFNKLTSNWQEGGASVWLNSNPPEPSVLVGDKLYYTMTSKENAYFALVHVDAKGHTSVLKPDAITGSDYTDPSVYSVFPPLTDECVSYEPREECFLPNNVIVQEGDATGKDTVYLFASAKPISNDVFMLQSGSDYFSAGKDLSLIAMLVNRISNEMEQNRIDVFKYSYNVESPDVQYATRAIGRVVVELEELASKSPQPISVSAPKIGISEVTESKTVEAEAEQIIQSAAPALVFNNIRFNHNSAEITAAGKMELSALGSVLVDRLELGKLPFVSLTGHTDSSGEASYNLNLSGQRAQSVKKYLINEWGLPASQIFSDGAGEALPVASNKTTQGRRQNRRVEFSVISSAN